MRYHPPVQVSVLPAPDLVPVAVSIPVPVDKATNSQKKRLTIEVIIEGFGRRVDKKEKELDG